jgi:ABC-2 type transport system permease protein
VTGAGLRQAVLSEWTKLHTVRSVPWTLTTMVAATVGTAVLVAATGSLHPDDTVLGGSLGNAAVGQLAAVIAGVLVAGGEYGSGTIRATFTANPRRLTVLAAKTAVVVAVVYTLALVSAGAAYLTGVLLLGDTHRSGTPAPALFGIAASFAAVGVLGVALGTALRHTAGAVTAGVAVLLLPTLLGPLLGDAGPWVSGASPVAALQKLAGSTDTAALGSMGGWTTLGVVYAYTAALLGLAAWLLRHRDA